MTSHMVLFLFAVSILMGAIFTLGIYYGSRQRRNSNVTWEQLMARLELVDARSIEQVALDMVDESEGRRTDGDAMQLEPEEVWTMIGSLEGLQRLERNSAVLIDMAFYLQRWYPEALPVAEELRLRARELQWHVDRLRSAAQKGKLEVSIAANAQNAATIYYLMTRMLLDLSRTVGFPGTAELQRAL